jgi:hypothetical protein
MKLTGFIRLCVVVMILGLSGCRRYYEWGRAQFDQVMYRDVHDDVIDPYVQSIDQYDGFTTVGHFDVLWYAQPVMRWYFKQYGDRVGACSDAWKKLYNEQSIEQQQRIVFYALLPYTDTTLKPQLSIEKSDISTWYPVLYIDGKEHQPIEIKKVLRVQPELAQIFASRFDPHYRVLYYIAYRRSCDETRDYLAEAQDICLVLRSASYEVEACWTPECLERHRRINEPIQ